MPRLVTVRLIVALFAFAAVSMDTATKVIHGVLHHREEASHAQLTGTDHAAGLVAPSVEATDVDQTHDGLHYAAVAPLSLAIACAMAVHTVALPCALEASDRGTPEFLVEKSPPGVRIGPRQSRAPPTA